VRGLINRSRAGDESSVICGSVSGITGYFFALMPLQQEGTSTDKYLDRFMKLISLHCKLIQFIIIDGS
jgi:hypothetical protein